MWHCWCMGNIIISAVHGVGHPDPMQCCVSSEIEPESVFLKHYFMSFKMLLDFFFPDQSYQKYE